MGGIYIYTEMPKSCCDCPCAKGNYCAITRYNPKFKEWYEHRPECCPLVFVPDHGRLIDADALITTFCEWGTCLERGRKLFITMCEAKQAIVDIIEDAPTIIQASGENENE